MSNVEHNYLCTHSTIYYIKDRVQKDSIMLLKWLRSSHVISFAKSTWGILAMYRDLAAKSDPLGCS